MEGKESKLAKIERKYEFQMPKIYAYYSLAIFLAFFNSYIYLDVFLILFRVRLVQQYNENFDYNIIFFFQICI